MSMEIPLVNPKPGFYYINPDAFTEVLDHLHEIVSRARFEYIQAVTDTPYGMTSLTPSLVLEMYPVTDAADADLARQLILIMKSDPILKSNLLLEIELLMSPIKTSIADLTLNNEQTQTVDMYDLFPYGNKIRSPEWEETYSLTLFFCLLQFSTNRAFANRLDTPHESIQQLFEREEIIGQMFALIGRTIKAAQLAHAH